MSGIEFGAPAVIYGLISVSVLIVAMLAIFIWRSRVNAEDQERIKRARQVEEDREWSMSMNERLFNALQAETREMIAEESKGSFLRALQKNGKNLGIPSEQVAEQFERRKVYDEMEGPLGSNKASRKDAKEEIPEYEKSDFNFSTWNLLSGYFSENGNTVYNPILRKKSLLIGKQDFFVKFQIFLNNLVKEGIYEINESSLRKIKRAIWKADPKAVMEEFDLVNKLDRFPSEFEGEPITGNRIFSKIMIFVLNHECYREYSKDMKGKIEKKHAEYKKLNIKRQQEKAGEPVTFTTEELEMQDKIRKEISVIKEVEAVVGKGFAEFLELDTDQHSLRLRIDPAHLFSKKIRMLIDYYKKDGALEKIQFYL